MHAAVEVDGERARFVIAGADEPARERLEQLGYSGCATRWFGRDGTRHFERFAASLQAMISPAGGWDRGLSEFLARVGGTRLRWWLYGSAALAVRGVPVEPHDVDLHVDDPHVAGRLLDDLLVTPVERLDGWVAAYTGRAFCGTIVEFLAEPHAALDDPAAPHEQGPLIESELERVRWRGHDILVPPLTAALRTAELRGLTDRAALIRASIGASGGAARGRERRSAGPA
jgi:hypothetical protein